LEPSPALARCALSVQSSAVYWAWSLVAAALALALLLADGEALEEAEGLAEELAELLADGVESAFRASVTARPWEVAEDVGLAELDEVAFSVALSVAFEEEPLEALGDGLADAAEPETSVARTGRK
jgi:hypothetical protein